MPDQPTDRPLSIDAITADLHTYVFGRKMFVLDTIASTNEFAKSLNPEEGPHGTVVTAEEQLSGKGRLGRRWESQRSKNLLFSILLRPDEAESLKAPLIPFAAAVAASEAIELATGLQVECKWPNDLLIGKKKVCGMLLESSMMGFRIEKIALGIGVNVNQDDFPAALLPHATSLLIEGGAPVDRSRLLQHMLASLEMQYARLLNEPVELMLNAWKKRSAMFGTRITVREAQGAIEGVAEELATDGSLLIRLDDGTLHTVRAGDVSLGYEQDFLHH